MKKSNKFSIGILITIIVVLVVAFAVLKPLVDVPWSQEEIEMNNEGITYVENESKADLYVVMSNYDTFYRKYKYEVVSNAIIYNSTNTELDNVTLTFSFMYGGRSHMVRHEIENLQAGTTVFQSEIIGEIYVASLYEYTSSQIDFTLFYDVADPQINIDFKLANEFVEPSIPPIHHNCVFEIITTIVPIIAFILGVLLAITIASSIRNKGLVEYESPEFTKQEKINIETPQVIEVNHKSLNGTHLVCGYCGNHFYKEYIKCPCCGAPLKRKRKTSTSKGSK